MDSTPPPVASQATTEGVLDPYNDCVYHLSNAYVYFPPQLASQIYTDGLVTSLRAKTINLESHYGDLMRDILQHLLGAKYTADEFAPGKRIIKVDAPFTGTAKWREGLTLNKRFHSSEGYNNIPAVREYRARNPAAQDSDRGSNSVS